MRGLRAVTLVGVLMLQGCVLKAVGVVADTAAGVTYTVLGIAQKTFEEDYDSVTAALQKTIINLDIKTGVTGKIEENGRAVKTEIEAFAGDLTIQITVKRVSDKATKVSVKASRKYLMKDRDFATQILDQTADNLAKKS